ncbi:B9D1 family protein [Megaselia abdita]
MNSAKSFHIYVNGQIDLISFPISYGNKIFLKYEIIYGPEWKLLSGEEQGISQTTTKTNNKGVVLNLPIDFIAKSTTPYGWPQILCKVYCKNWFYTNLIGYSRVHVPIFSSAVKTINAPILQPKFSNFWNNLNWRTPEMKYPEILIEGTQNKGFLMDSYGEVVFQLQTSTRGSSAFEYCWKDNRV